MIYKINDALEIFKSKQNSANYLSSSLINLEPVTSDRTEAKRNVFA